ncbi:hypothetical protein EV191_1011201 [Tamaricihabitans halophyticus]|uniref:DoxX-like protein n=1 Tax=Tamaricihabitans halophyticus TaxID=1262583 RepID=A0A4R2R614_9PSEU|nr:hypothetical protein [Tamaricihabitans halophyticus]TCP57248.1 hypothetical protein EV191_1011201 [Tamaricihabitans halophyticus]
MAKLSRAFGLLLAGTGAAHFAAPQAFESISKTAFPEDTTTWVYRNGATEVALGLALTSRRTRKLGTIGLLGYTAWLGGRFMTAQR